MKQNFLCFPLDCCISCGLSRYYVGHDILIWITLDTESYESKTINSNSVTYVQLNRETFIKTMTLTTFQFSQ